MKTKMLLATSLAIFLSACGDSGSSNQPPVSGGDLPQDTTPPVLSLRVQQSSPTNAAAIIFTATSNEPISQVQPSSCLLSNGTVSSITTNGDTLCIITVQPTSDGVVSLQLKTGAVVDVAGNPSATSAVVSVLSDRTVPGYSFATANVAGSFSEPVTVTINDQNDRDGTLDTVFSSDDLSISATEATHIVIKAQDVGENIRTEKLTISME